MQIKALTNRLREAETNSCWDYYNQSKREHDLIEAEEILRERAERAFTKWLDKSYNCPECRTKIDVNKN